MFKDVVWTKVQVHELTWLMSAVLPGQVMYLMCIWCKMGRQISGGMKEVESKWMLSWEAWIADMITQADEEWISP